jgi:hypothetical protein
MVSGEERRGMVKHIVRRKNSQAISQKTNKRISRNSDMAQNFCNSQSYTLNVEQLRRNIQDEFSDTMKSESYEEE